MKQHSDMNVRVFQCSHDDEAGVDEKLAQRLDLRFPEAYLRCEMMEKLALGIKEEKQAAFCVLPFCHTVEGEALGGRIHYGDAHIGPRAGERLCTAAEDVLALPPMDFSSGRIAEVLTACRELSARGENVMLNMSGPLTILNVLMETSCVFSVLMEDTEYSQAVFRKLNGELLRYTERAVEAGVAAISYADPIGAADILGPDLARGFAERVTLPFLASANAMILNKQGAPGIKTFFFLCPKTIQSLSALEQVRWSNKALQCEESGPNALLRISGPSRIVGSVCVKQILKGLLPEEMLFMEAAFN